jgi:hypothetical protein
MGLDALPTDNLYQFLALAGLLLITVSVLGPWREAERLLREYAELMAKLAVLEAETDHALQEIDDIEKELEEAGLSVHAMPDSQDQGDETPATPAMPEHVWTRLKSDVTRLRSLQLDRVRARAELRAKKKLVDAMHDRAIIAGRWAKRAVVGGALISLLGFALWYVRIQRHQDELLRRQVAVPESAPAPTSTIP